MFGFGILTYLKIGAVVVILGVCGYYVYSYHSMQTQIASLQLEVANQKLEIEVLDKARVATEEFMKAKTKVVYRNVQQKAEVDRVVESNDSAAMESLFIRRGLLQDNRNNPKGGQPSRP